MKPKIILAIIAILAVAGGTLASKAKTTYNGILYTTNSYSGRATVTVEATTTAFGSQKVYVTSVYNQVAGLFTYTVFKE